MTTFDDVVQTGFGLLAFHKIDLQRAREHFLVALEIADADPTPAGRLRFAACALHAGHTATFIGHSGEAKLLLAAADESLNSVDEAVDAVTSYALQHGRWFAQSLRSIEAVRRGDHLLAERYRRLAEQLKPDVSVSTFLRQTIDTSGGEAAYAALALMQDDPAALVAALTESVRPLATADIQRAAMALSAAEAIFDELKKASWFWPLGELYLAEGSAHILRSSGRYAEAAAMLSTAEHPLLSEVGPVDELRALMLVERGRLLMEIGEADEAARALNLVLSLPNLSPSLRRIALHEKADWQADAESAEAAIQTLEFARNLGGSLRWHISTLIRLANLNLRIGLLVPAEGLVREATKASDEFCESRGEISSDLDQTPAVVSAEYLSWAELRKAAKLVSGEARRIRSLGHITEAQNTELLKESYARFAEVADSGAADTPNGLAILLTAKLGMGAVACALRLNNEAKAFYQEVIRATEMQDGSAQLRRIRRDAEVNLAALAYRMGDLKNALEWSSALAEMPALDRSQQALCHFLRGATMDALGDEGAVEEYRRAQEIYEAISGSLRPEILGNFQEAQTGFLYARLARALARQGKPWKALAAADAGRAQGLARRVREHAQLSTSKRASEVSPEKLAELTSARPDTLYLFWQILEIRENSEEMLLFSICGERITIREVLYRPSLRLRIDALREALLPGKSRDSFVDLGRDLYNDLLAPDINDAEIRQVTIIPDGPLHELPWGALIDEQDRFLIERCPFSLLSSMGTLALPTSSSGSDRLLRVAYDPFPEGLYRNGRLIARPIPHVYEEARVLASIWKDGLGIVDPPPRVDSVIEALSKASWAAALFSLHARCNQQDGLKSALILAGDQDSSVAFLEAWQIASIQMNCRVAFLSACDTGRGRQTGTEGLLGLAWAFRAAGCSATVATLWPVADHSMPALVARFFSHLRSGQTALDALRHACICMLRGDDTESLPPVRSEWQHPYFWAAVQIWGEA